MMEFRLVVSIGETMGLIRAGQAGRLAPGSALVAGMGGAESNFAIALARLDRPAAWISWVGDDDFGRLIMRELRAEGVVAVHQDYAEGAPTGLMVKTTPLPGRQSVTYYRKGSAASRMTPADVPDDLIAQAGALHITGITLAISESARDTAFHAARVARAAGVPVSFDVNHRGRLWTEAAARPVYREFVALADIVFAGPEEAQLVLGTQEDDIESLLHGLAELGSGLPVIKDGANGAHALVDGRPIFQPAVPVAAVDTVGAGDGFAAGFIDARLDGLDVAQCLELGAQVGAFACLSHGDWEGYPTREDLTAFTSGSDVVSR